MRDEHEVAEAVVPVIAAVIAFLDTDAAFGATHVRALAAKKALADRVAAFLGEDDATDPPLLHVISTRRADQPANTLNDRASGVANAGPAPHLTVYRGGRDAG